MSQHLCIGIQHLNDEWESLLNMIGVWFGQVDYTTDLNTGFSIIILNRKPDAAQTRKLKKFIDEGGAIVETLPAVTFNKSSHIRTSSQKTLLANTEHPCFSSIPYVDVISKIGLHSQSGIFSGLVHVQKMGKGVLAFIGTDIASLLQDQRYARKRFFSPTHKNPNEIVSKVSKQQLADIFIALLKELHLQRELPFIQKWTSPSQKPIFSFRVDSDYGDQASTDRLYETLAKYKLKATWFLHVKAHESWLQQFHSYHNQEIALHGYRHGVSTNSSKVLANIQQGKQLLEKAGFSPSGFCAPYGIRNHAITQAFKAIDFDYTSEFTFSYDGLPLQPTQKAQPLQIPIHPICTGSLNRQNYTAEQMSEYFMQVLSRKAARFKPVIFYHHPLQAGLESFEPVFQKIHEGQFQNLTFKEYADFWESRTQCQFEARYHNQELTITTPTSAGQLFQVSTDHQKFILTPASAQKIDLQKSPEFEYSKAYLPEPAQVAEMRTKNLKLMKTSLLDWKNRARL